MLQALPQAAAVIWERHAAHSRWHKLSTQAHYFTS